MNNIKKITQKDRHGAMISYEFNVPSLNEVPKPEIDPSVFKPKGTDTVPAMLTPGENVVNAEASRLPGNQQMIDQMNDQGRAIQKQQGGPIPSYEADGGRIPEYASAGSDLRDYLKSVEGVRNESYQDSGGNYTVGVGNTDNVDANTTLTNDQVDNRLDQDIAVVENDYKNLVNVNLNDNQANSVKSLLFNIGGPNFAKSKALAALNSGDFETYKKEMAEFRLANGKVVPGLENRRASELALFNKEVPSVQMASNESYPNSINLGSRNSSVMDKSGAAWDYIKRTTNQAYNDPSIIIPRLKRNAKIMGTNIADTYNDLFPEEPNRGPGYNQAKYGMPSIPADTSETGLGNQIINKIDGGEFDWDKAFGGKKANPFNSETGIQDITNTIVDGPGEMYDIVSDGLENYGNKKHKIIAKQMLVDKTKDVDYYKNKYKEEPNANNESKLKEAIIEENKFKKIVSDADKKILDKEALEALETEKYKNTTVKEIVNEVKNKNDPEIGKIKGIFSAIVDVPKNNNKVDPDKVKEKEEQGDVDPTIVEKMTGWFGDVFKDMFSGPELARMAVTYAASRALGYDHGNSLEHSGKQYIKRVDKDISDRQAFITNKENLKTFTTKTLKEYRETGDLSKLERINKGLVPKGTGPMIYHDKYGPLPTFRTGKDTYAIEYNGKLYPYNHPEMMGFTSTYDKELHEPQKVSDFFKNRGVSSIKGANANITEDGKVIDEGLAASTADAAANRYLKDAQLYGGDPAARSQLRLHMIKAQEEFWIDYGIAVEKGTTRPNSVLSYYNKRAIPMKTKGIVSTNDFENANAQAVQKLDAVILRVSQFSKDKTKRVSPAIEAKQYKQLWGALKTNWDKNSPGSRWAKRMADDKADGNGVKNNSFTYWASKILATDSKEHAEAMKLLTSKFQLKSNQR